MRLWLFLRLWSLLWHLGLPVVLFYLWRRGRRDPLYSQHLGERLGRFRQHLPGAVWVHAVSLGEVRSAVPLIRALLDRGETVVTTHFTPAGRREAERVFANDIAAGRLAAVWVPVETAWAFRGFFRAFRPRVGLVMEIEIWPRMIFAAKGAGVPLYMCNAQYPSRSMKRDAKFPLRHDLMRGFAGALVKSDLQAQRFASVGVQNITVTGELRFDQPVPPHLTQAAPAARALLADERPVITFASAVEGEDELYLSAMARALTHPSRPFFVYVPRKPERFDTVAEMLAARGFRVLRRSEGFDAALAVRQPPAPDWGGEGTAGAPAGLLPDVLLGDSLGEMYFYIALADRVVTGGGFTPQGAHNIIEPLALQRPVIVGPRVHTIEYPAVEAIAAGVCRKVRSPQALTNAVIGWRGPGPEAIAAFFATHSGATDRTLAALDSIEFSTKIRTPGPTSR
jgi:3-deoxy-D-manno-octulosonic-acid transferase